MDERITIDVDRLREALIQETDPPRLWARRGPSWTWPRWRTPTPTNSPARPSAAAGTSGGSRFSAACRSASPSPYRFTYRAAANAVQ